MRIRPLAVGTLIACLCSSALGAEYVLDVTVLAARYANQAEEGDQPVQLKRITVRIPLTPGERIDRKIINQTLAVELKGRFKSTKTGRFEIDGICKYHWKCTDKRFLSTGAQSMEAICGPNDRVEFALAKVESTCGSSSTSPRVLIRFFTTLERMPRNKREYGRQRNRIRRRQRNLLDEIFNRQTADDQEALKKRKP